MPRDSYYRFFILVTVIFSSYLGTLECSMRSSGYGDYSPSNLGSISGGSLESEVGNGDFFVPETARHETSGSMSANADFFIYEDSLSPKPLVKRKRKPSNVEASFIREETKAVETESFKKKCVPKKEGDKFEIPSKSIVKFAEIPAKFTVPPTQTHSFKGFSSRLEPIVTNFSPQSSTASSLTAPEMITPIPLKNGFLSFSRVNRQKHTNLVGLSPESVAFSPIPSSSGAKMSSDLDESENSVVDEELAGIFEGFGLIDIDDEGRAKGAGFPI